MAITAAVFSQGLLALRCAIARFYNVNDRLLAAGESNKLSIKQVLRGRNTMTGAAGRSWFDRFTTNGPFVLSLSKGDGARSFCYGD